MNKSLFFIAAAALALCPLKTAAQIDDGKPGIYAIVDGQSIPMTYTYGKASVEGENLYGVEISYNTFIFGGETSAVSADSIFLLVLDPQLSKSVKKMKEYNPFIKSMKPGSIILVPLKVNAGQHRREYYQGAKWEVLRFDDRGSIKFSWKKLDRNSFKFNAHTLPPGEYGFIFKTEAFMGYDYTAIFAFTVKDKDK